MTDRFANLKAACGGSLSPETLTQFEAAMREYKVFMHGMREMFDGTGDDVDEDR